MSNLKSTNAGRFKRHTAGGRQAGMTRSTRRLLAVASGACAAAMSLSVPAAASAAPVLGPFAGKTLTVLGFTSAGTNDPAAFNKYYSAVEAAFHKETGATLKGVTASPSEGALNQALQELEVTHSGEDVYAIGSTLGPSIYYNTAFAHLTNKDWAEIGGLKQFYPDQLLDGGVNGSYAYVPFYNVPDAMVYNTKLFKAAGVSKPPRTWTQYIADAEKVNDPSKEVYGTAMDPGDSTDPWKTLWFFMKSYGPGDYVNARGTTAEIDSPKVQKAVEFWFDWYTKWHIVNPASLTWDASQMEAAFASGKVGEEVVQKSLDIPVYKSGSVGNSYAFAPMPCVPYGDSALPKGASCPGTFLSADGFAISKYGNVPLALQMMKIILEPKFQVMYFNLTGGLPVTTYAGTLVKKADPAEVTPFVHALFHQQPTPFVSAWATIESAMAGVASKSAAEVASKGDLPTSYIASTLRAANTAVQEQLR